MSDKTLGQLLYESFKWNDFSWNGKNITPFIKDMYEEAACKFQAVLHPPQNTSPTKTVLVEIIQTLQDEVCEGKRSNASAIREAAIRGCTLGKTQV